MGSRQYWPIQVDVPGCRIVELVSGGWLVLPNHYKQSEFSLLRSFSALDSEGQVHVLGMSTRSFAGPS
jgi:hypothetical protein